MFPILDHNQINDKNLAKSMKILQNNKKSTRIIEDSNGLKSKNDLNIRETKAFQPSATPYGNMVQFFTDKPNFVIKKKFIAFILHGLEGNPFDMRHIRAALLDCIPDCSVYIINNNFKLTNHDLNIQAKRLALEVREILTFMNFFGNFFF